MRKKTIGKVQGTSLLVAIALIWIPLTRFGLSQMASLGIASGIVLINAIVEIMS